MTKNKHFRRLEHIYASDLPSGAGNVSVNFGRALLNAVVAEANSGPFGDEGTPHQKLMSDAAALAAGSLEKERTVTAENFDVNIKMPDYTGEVVATARVVMAQPPKFVVQVALVTNDGDVVAQGQGVYKPSGEDLPPDPHPEMDSDEGGALAGAPGRPNDTAGPATPTAEESAPEPQPASFMPVFPTPMGMMCLN